jgi:hypothetical protein
MVHYKSATLSVSQSTLVSQHEGASDETFVHLLRMIDKVIFFLKKKALCL